MRNLQYLSPSGIAAFEKDQTEYYLCYLADSRAPRFQQTLPMAAGSAFDAYIKSFLHEALFGKGNDPKFELMNLFTCQVEEQNRDEAFEVGKYLFNQYRESGALSDLLSELSHSVGTPRFEFEAKGVINGHREGITKQMDSGVVFLGKPDARYINQNGLSIQLDWKVSGFYSPTPPSPMPAYLKIRSQGRIVKNAHIEAFPFLHRGIKISGRYLDELNQDWSRQMSIYGWLLGEEIGDDFVVAIDQLVCKTTGSKFPEVRVAEHRLRISSDFQWKLFARCQEIWEITHSNHFFRDMSEADSRAKCEALELRAKALANPENENDQLFNEMTRKHGY